MQRVRQLVVPDESPSRDRPEEERVALRLGALDKVSLEADEKTELEREKQVRAIDQHRNQGTGVFWACRILYLRSVPI